MGNYERYVPVGNAYSAAKTVIASVALSANGGTVVLSMSTPINVLALVVSPATAGAHELYFAESALASPDTLGDDHLAYGNYGSNGGEAAGWGPYFPKRSKGTKNIVGKGAGVVRVRAYYYETSEGS